MEWLKKLLDSVTAEEMERATPKNVVEEDDIFIGELPTDLRTLKAALQRETTSVREECMTIHGLDGSGADIMKKLFSILAGELPSLEEEKLMSHHLRHKRIEALNDFFWNAIRMHFADVDPKVLAEDQCMFIAPDWKVYRRTQNLDNDLDHVSRILSLRGFGQSSFGGVGGIH